MTGLILFVPRCERRERAVVLEERRILGVRFCCAVIRREGGGERTLGRRVLRAARGMVKLGVRETVVPEGFAFGNQLDRAGLRQTEVLPLARELAADLAGALLWARGVPPEAACAAMLADTLTAEAARTAIDLALRCRYLLLETDRTGEVLCRRLRREYGVPVRLDPGREQLSRAHVLVLFSPMPEAERGTAAVVPLYPGSGFSLPPLTLPQEAERAMPYGVRRDQLTAVLRRAGALSRGDVTVSARDVPLTFTGADTIIYPHDNIE